MVETKNPPCQDEQSTISQAAADFISLFSKQRHRVYRNMMIDEAHYSATGEYRWVPTEFQKAFDDALDAAFGPKPSADESNPK